MRREAARRDRGRRWKKREGGVTDTERDGERKEKSEITEINRQTETDTVQRQIWKASRVTDRQRGEREVGSSQQIAMEKDREGENNRQTDKDGMTETVTERQRMTGRQDRLMERKRQDRVERYGQTCRKSWRDADGWIEGHKQTE